MDRKEMEKLVARVKSGDKDAYAELIKPIENTLYGIARQNTRNEDDANDAVQEAIINAYFGIHRLKDGDKFNSWIYVITRNCCKKMYQKRQKRNEYIDETADINEAKYYEEEPLNIDHILRLLTEKEQEIFKLYHIERLTTRQISKMINMNENTIKTHLRRSNEKIRRRFTRQTLFILVLCLVVLGSVAAITFINYIKGLFETGSVGVNNDGVLMAIENMDWYQQVDMDYIDLGNGNKLKVDYISLDEMSLYMVMDFESEEDISKYDRIYFEDLKITNENNEVICDIGNELSEQRSINAGDKTIENDAHHIKFLVYIYADSMPISNKLNIQFSKMGPQKKSDIKEVVNKETAIDIEMSEKFNDRKVILYNSDNSDIIKALVSRTGLYVKIKLSISETIKSIQIKDEQDNTYKCNFVPATTSNSDTEYEYLIISNLYVSEINELIITVNNKEYKLTK